MSEVTPPSSNASNSQRLLEIFNNLLPLVDSVADKLRFALILGVGLIAWIFGWLFFIKQFSLSTALIIAGLALLPIIIIARFWWSLEQLKDLPHIAQNMMSDASQEIGETVKGIREGKVQKLSFLGSAKGLWSIGSLAGEAKELLGSYISIGVLLNPLSLILGFLSLLFMLPLMLVSVVLLGLAIF